MPRVCTRAKMVMIKPHIYFLNLQFFFINIGNLTNLIVDSSVLGIRSNFTHTLYIDSSYSLNSQEECLFFVKLFYSLGGTSPSACLDIAFSPVFLRMILDPCSIAEADVISNIFKSPLSEESSNLGL